MKNEKIRNPYIDIIKSILIILVIIGHSIQYGSGNNYLVNQLFFNNIFFKFIYSFHMPLFIIISGYLSYNSINKNNFKTILKSKINTLIIPIFIWSLITLLFLNISNITNIKDLLKLIITTFSTNLWFLWTLFYLNILVKLINKFFKDNLLVYMLIFIITFILPNNLEIKHFVFQLSLYGFMYPFFLLGYFYKKYNLNEKLKSIINNKLTIFINTIIFILLLLLFNKNTYIYTTGLNIINNHKQLIIDLYRYLIGLIGSIEILLFVNLFINEINNKIKNALLYLGKNTLGIYILSSIIHPYILPTITKNINNINYLLVLLESIIIISISIIIVKIIKKNHILNKYLLGESKR